MRTASGGTSGEAAVVELRERNATLLERAAELHERNGTLEESLRETLDILDAMRSATPLGEADVETLQVAPTLICKQSKFVNLVSVGITTRPFSCHR